MQRKFTAEKRTALIAAVEKHISQGLSERKACEKAGAPYSAYRYWRDRGFTSSSVVPQSAAPAPVAGTSMQLINATTLGGRADMAALIGPRHVLERLLRVYRALNNSGGLAANDLNDADQPVSS